MMSAEDTNAPTTLTSDELDAVVRYLSSLGTPAPCPVCSANAWFVLRELVCQPMVKPNSTLLLDWCVPFVTLTCNACSFARQFAWQTLRERVFGSSLTHTPPPKLQRKRKMADGGRLRLKTHSERNFAYANRHPVEVKP